MVGGGWWFFRLSHDLWQFVEIHPVVMGPRFFTHPTVGFFQLPNAVPAIKDPGDGSADTVQIRPTMESLLDEEWDLQTSIATVNGGIYI